MKKLLTLMVAALLSVPSITKAQNDVNIGKSNIKLSSRMMTPEALWAMGRIGTVEASPDGRQVVYQVGYYSVKANKSHQVICIMNADGSQNRQLTTSSKSETDPTWLDAETIAYLSGGEVWSMKADGSSRRQLSKTNGEVEGFKFSPDRQQVILIKSMPFHEVIKKNPADLPKATGRRVTDLMYRHWDHYVESIQHPFLYTVSADGIAANGVDILEGEPYECPMEPFGGIEQLAWSPDSKTIAYTCRKKTGTDYATSTDSDIYLYNIGTRETKNLCKPEGYKAPKSDPSHTKADQAVNRDAQMMTGYDQNPQFSPDGRYIAWQSMTRDGYEADLNRLCIYSLTDGSKRFLSWKSDVEAFCWAPATGKKVKAADARFYFLSVWHGCCNMYSANQKGEVTQLTQTWDDWTSLQMANNGQRIIATRQSLSAPTDIYLVTPDDKKMATTTVQL
ncbi:MAG: peptidase S9, partial [Prevotella sp.]|nr:peptidase S9 [Prevotella sp.]